MPLTLSDTAENPRSASAVSVDEVAVSSPAAAEIYGKVETQLLDDSLDSVNAQAQRTMRDLGVTFSLYGETPRDHVVPMDLFPRVIDAEEWTTLMRGLAQRVAIWNALFRDIYDSQEVLKAGVLPFEIVYSDTNYLRAAVGVKVPNDVYVHAAAFDLARDNSGRWMVIDDYVSRTTGASYALQARSVLSQVKPELFESASVLPNHGFPNELLDHLRSYAQAGSSEPRVVALTGDFYNHAYYEDSYLARQMGIPLVRGNDLIVLNTRVYYKTIAGLEPIDVIYRRMPDAGIDPLALSRGQFIGVPGLMTCVRKGTVTVANAIGSGLGKNRAIAAYLPRLAKFYLNEKLLIPQIRRLLCYDPDQCEQVLTNLRDYFVTTVTSQPGQEVWRTVDFSEEELSAVHEKITASPEKFVAEPYMPLNLMPASPANLAPRHAGLRVFTLGGRAMPNYPIALTRAAIDESSRVISSGLGGSIKDTWILRDDSTETEPQIFVSPPSTQRRLQLGSRIADSLYWMGRYAERAENTARIFKTLQVLQTEDRMHQNERSWAPLWEALARATGHPTNFFKRVAAKGESSAFYVLLDAENASSVLSCVERCRRNGQVTRESVPPEVWSAIQRVDLLLKNAAPTKKRKALAAVPNERIIELSDDVLSQLDALSGAVQKHMLRDSGWQFWHLGVHLERAFTTVLVMRQVFLKRQGEAAQQQQMDSNLDALLRMLASLYAYRSLFQTRPVFQNVATMLLQDAQVPHSLLYCLEKLDATLGATFRQSPYETASTPARLCSQLKCDVSFLELAQYFEPAPSNRAPDLAKLLESFEAKLNKLSTAISDHYLYHQAINVLR